jgi:hypothetical protein
MNHMDLLPGPLLSSTEPRYRSNVLDRMLTCFLDRLIDEMNFYLLIFLIMLKYYYN